MQRSGGGFYPERQVPSARARYCLATEITARGSYMEYVGWCGYDGWGVGGLDAEIGQGRVLLTSRGSYRVNALGTTWPS